MHKLISKISMPLLAEPDIAAHAYAPQIILGPMKKTNNRDLDLLARAADGDALAQNTLIAQHMTLIESLAHKMATTQMPQEDLVSEGVIGMIRAIALFNPAAGAQLSTYAVPWIKANISRALSNCGQIIRLPIDVGSELYKMRVAAEGLTEKLGREPSVNEIADAMNVDPERVAHLQQVSCPVSLDSHGLSEEGDSMVEEVSDPEQLNPSQAAIASEMSELLMGVLADGTLERLEAFVIDQRFGISGVPVRSLEEIGVGLKTSRDSVRRIQKTALMKLREVLSDRGL